MIDNGGTGTLASAVARRPREFVGGLMAAIAVVSISANALFLQKGPHPAPIFATRPVQQLQTTIAPPQPVLAQPQTQSSAQSSLSQSILAPEPPAQQSVDI